MRRQTLLTAVVGFFGLIAAAGAQTPSPAARGPFDGTYRLVSSARVNQLYTSKKGLTAQCPERVPGRLTISQGRARYTSATGYRLRGSVGPQGELAMRSSAPGISRTIDINLNGNIDTAGTVRARQTSNACNYDFVWQRSSR
jgi:hypothetical protein